jgi:hypothetical protein
VRGDYLLSSPLVSFLARVPPLPPASLLSRVFLASSPSGVAAARSPRRIQGMIQFLWGLLEAFCSCTVRSGVGPQPVPLQVESGSESSGPPPLVSDSESEDWPRRSPSTGSSSGPGNPQDGEGATQSDETMVRWCSDRGMDMVMAQWGMAHLPLGPWQASSSSSLGHGHDRFRMAMREYMRAEGTTAEIAARWGFEELLAPQDQDQDQEPEEPEDQAEDHGHGWLSDVD